jgi:hypothetical protein
MVLIGNSIFFINDLSIVVIEFIFIDKYIAGAALFVTLANQFRENNKFQKPGLTFFIKVLCKWL